MLQNSSFTVDKILDQNLQAACESHVNPGSGLKEIRDQNLKPVPISVVKPETRSDQNPESELDLNVGSILDLKPETRSCQNPGSSSNETRNLNSGATIVETKDLEPESRSDKISGPRSKQTSVMQHGFRLELSRSLNKPESRSGLRPAFKPDLKVGFTSQDTRDVHPEARPDLSPASKTQETTGPSSDIQPGFPLNLKPGSRSNKTISLQNNGRMMECRAHQSPSPHEGGKHLQPRSRSDQRFEPSDPQAGVKTESTADRTGNPQPASRLEVNDTCRSCPGGWGLGWGEGGFMRFGWAEVMWELRCETTTIEH